MAVSYQSRFFLFWRQQWHRWQQQWQRQQWQVESTLSGVWQLITGIFTYLWQQGLPQLKGSQHQARLAGSSCPPADSALQAVSAAIQLCRNDHHPLTVQLRPLPRRRSWWQRLFPPLNPPVPEGALTTQEPCYLACDRHHRSFILLTSTGTPLKTLTPEEQQRVEQRIYYELACYFQRLRQWYRQRHHRRRWHLPGQSTVPACLTTQFLQQLRVTSAPASVLSVEVPALSPLGQLWQRWRSRLPLVRRGALSQVRVQGIASQLENRAIVLIGTDQSILYTFSAEQQQQILAWIERHLSPLQASTQHWLSHVSYWLAGVSPLRPSPLLAATEPLPALPSLVSDAAATPLTVTPRGMDVMDSDRRVVDVEAAFVGYELHWFEVLLLWCDRLLLWIEERLMAFVNWLKGRLNGL
ncbi:hypothetical protein RYO59_001954 [Thermosynechococcaceae cyanobacterium Okahandja]